MEPVGPQQLAFFGAASKALKGQRPNCPNCSAQLRSYFHAFDPSKPQGTIWVWCGACFRHCHLPRVTPLITCRDPFSETSREAFSQLERSTNPFFLDRLESLWSRGEL